MGTIQPEIIADVAWAARGRDLGAAAGVRVYSGPAWPGVGQLEAWGVPWGIGYEGITTRAYAGYDAGGVDAASLIGRLRAEKPDYLDKRCSVWFCAADEPSTPAWALPGITDYGRGYADECYAEGFFPATIDPYGNRDAILAAKAGLHASNLWGVGTWGNGEGSGANQMPAESDCAVLQSGNTPGPVPGDTDFNAVYVPFAELHLYGGPAPAPIPTPDPEDDDVANIFIGKKSDAEKPADQQVGIFVADGLFPTWKRHVKPEEWKMANDLCDYAQVPRPTIHMLGDEHWDSIPTGVPVA